MDIKSAYWRIDNAVRRQFDPFPHVSYVKKRGFLFVHIPKTAGTSIIKALGIHFRHHSDYMVYEQANPKAFYAAFKFCFVRNPYDRLVSTYFYLSRGGAGRVDERIASRINRNARNFSEFVQKIVNSTSIHTHVLFRPQISFVCDFDLAPRVDFVGKFETIRDDFEYVAQRIGVSADLPTLNSQSKRPFGSYYTPQLADEVFKLYSADFQVFGYSKESFVCLPDTVEQLINEHQ